MAFLRGTARRLESGPCRTRLRASPGARQPRDGGSREVAQRDPGEREEERMGAPQRGNLLALPGGGSGEQRSRVGGAILGRAAGCALRGAPTDEAFERAVGVGTGEPGRAADAVPGRGAEAQQRRVHDRLGGGEPERGEVDSRHTVVVLTTT